MVSRLFESNKIFGYLLLVGFLGWSAIAPAYASTTESYAANLKIENLINGQELIEATAGETITITLRVSNIGSVTASNVQVEDLLPSGLTYVEGSSASTGAVLQATSPRLQWKIASLAAGAFEQIAFMATLDAGLAEGSCGSNLVNQATANALGSVQSSRAEGCSTSIFFNECAYVGDIATVRVKCLPPPQLTLTKQSEVLCPPLKNGSWIQYTLTLKNEGEYDAADVSVVDILPAQTHNLTILSAAGDQGSAGAWFWTAEMLTVVFNQVKAGETCTITFKLQVKDDAPCDTVVVNRAKAVAGNLEFGSNETSDRIECTAIELKLTKESTVLNPPLKSGSWLQYTLILQNEGDRDVADVSVIDTISTLTENITIESATGDKGSAGNWYWAAEMLTVVFNQVKAGETCTIVFKVQVKSDAGCEALVVNRAKAVVGTLEFHSNEISDSIGCQAPDLEIFKEAKVLDGVLKGGSSIQYTITVKNSGDLAAANVLVIDTLDALTSLDAASVSVSCADGCDVDLSGSSNSQLSVRIAEIEGGETCKIVFKVSVSEEAGCDSRIVNKARFEFDTQSAWSNETSLQITCPPDLCSSTKAVTDLDGGKLKPGDLVEYRIQLNNSSSTNATAVRVTDELSAYLENLTITQLPMGAEDHSTGGSLDIGNIAVPSKGSVLLVFQARVRANTKGGSRISNMAVIHPAMEGGETCCVRSRDLVVAYCGKSYEIVGQIDLGGDPVMGAVNPVTHEAVITSGLLNRIVIVDLASQQVVGYVPVESPHGVAINPETNEAVVTNIWSDTLTIVDLNQRTVTDVIRVGSIPKGVAINPNTGQAVVINSGSGSASIVDLETRKVVATVAVGYGPDGVAINPATNMAAISNYRSGTVALLDLDARKLVANIPAGEFPLGVAFDTATNLLYAANQGDGTLSTIDPEARNLLGHITVGSRSSMPDQVDIDSETSRAAVSVFNDHSVVFLNLSTGEILAQVDTRQAGGRGPRGVAMDRDLGIVLVVHQQSNIVVLISM